MPREPENPATWEEYQHQVNLIRKAVDNLDAPPTPNEELGQATFRMRQAVESMENTTEAMIRREMHEE